MSKSGPCFWLRDTSVVDATYTTAGTFFGKGASCKEAMLSPLPLRAGNSEQPSSAGDGAAGVQACHTVASVERGADRPEVSGQPC